MFRGRWHTGDITYVPQYMELNQPAHGLRFLLRRLDRLWPVRLVPTLIYNSSMC
jgi:hypothetical protein